LAQAEDDPVASVGIISMGAIRAATAACVVAGALAQRFIATGVYVESVSGDDGYTGQTNIEFLIYLKGVLPDAAEGVVTTVCPEDVITTNRTFEGATNVVLTNAAELGHWKNQCPNGAEGPPGFTCYRVSGSFRYTPQANTFPFGMQSFEIVAEDSGAPFAGGTSFCVVPELTALSTKFSQVMWDEDPALRYRLQTDCYWHPDCTNGRKSLTISIDVNRPWLKMVLRYFIAPSIVMFLAIMQYNLHPVKQAVPRFSSTTALLFTLVTFHVSATNSLFQRNSGFSYFDGYVFFAYTIILVASVDNVGNLLWQGAGMWRHELGDEGAECLDFLPPLRPQVYCRLHMDMAVQCSLVLCAVLHCLGARAWGGQFSFWMSIFTVVLVLSMEFAMHWRRASFEVRVMYRWHWLHLLISGTAAIPGAAAPLAGAEAEMQQA